MRQVPLHLHRRVPQHPMFQCWAHDRRSRSHALAWHSLSGCRSPQIELSPFEGCSNLQNLITIKCKNSSKFAFLLAYCRFWHLSTHLAGFLQCHLDSFVFAATLTKKRLECCYSWTGCKQHRMDWDGLSKKGNKSSALNMRVGTFPQLISLPCFGEHGFDLFLHCEIK